MKPTARTQHEVFVFLDDLRESGVINMYGATPHIVRAFDVSEDEAIQLLVAWMNSKKDSKIKKANEAIQDEGDDAKHIMYSQCPICGEEFDGISRYDLEKQIAIHVERAHQADPQFYDIPSWHRLYYPRNPKSNEGGFGSGKEGHVPWMKEIEKDESLSEEQLKREKFLVRAQEILDNFVPVITPEDIINIKSGECHCTENAYEWILGKLKSNESLANELENDRLEEGESLAGKTFTVDGLREGYYKKYYGLDDGEYIVEREIKDWRGNTGLVIKNIKTNQSHIISNKEIREDPLLLNDIGIESYNEQYCPDCGEEIFPEDTHCYLCGRQVVSDDEKLRRRLSG